MALHQTKLNQETLSVKKMTLLGLNVGIKFLAVGLGFYTSFWLNSYLNSEELRLYNLIISFTPVVLSLIDMGLPSLMQKAYTNDYHPDKEGVQENGPNQKIRDIWTTLNIIRLATYGIGFVLIFMLQRLSNVDDLGLILLIFTAQYILLTDLNYQAVCNAVDKAWQYSITDFISKATLIIGLLLFAFGWTNNITSPFYYSASGSINISGAISPVWYFAIVSLLANLVAIFADGFWQRKHTKWGRFQWAIVKGTLAPIILLSVGKIIFSSYLTTHRLFLDRFVDSEVLNGYTNASRLLEIATIVPALTMPTIASIVQRQFIAGDSQNQLVFDKIRLPKVSNWLQMIFRAKDNNNFALQSLIQWIVLTTIMGIVCYLGLALFGPVAIWIIQLNRDYPSAYLTLSIMAVGILPTFVSTFTSHILVFNGHEKLEVASIFITGIITLSLYFVLIPGYGLVGAAFASSLSFFILAFVRAFYAVRIVSQGKIKTNPAEQTK